MTVTTVRVLVNRWWMLEVNDDDPARAELGVQLERLNNVHACHCILLMASY